MEGKTLNIYEDGAIDRDRFVFVDDVVAAFVAACATEQAVGRIVNVGAGRRTSIADAARLILAELGLPESRHQVTGAFRAGDIRHAVADITNAETLLGWTPQVSFEQGVSALVAWARAEAGA